MRALVSLVDPLARRGKRAEEAAEKGQMRRRSQEASNTREIRFARGADRCIVTASVFVGAIASAPANNCADNDTRRHPASLGRKHKFPYASLLSECNFASN